MITLTVHIWKNHHNILCTVPTFESLNFELHLHSGGVECLSLHVALLMELQQRVMLTLQLVKVSLQHLQLDRTEDNTRRW